MRVTPWSQFDGVGDALDFFGLEKDAKHSLDRLQERTQLDPEIIPWLEAEADRLGPTLSAGFYYLPLRNEHGVVVAYAAFKTVDTLHGPRLVLATILAGYMRPKGENLEGRMQHPPYTKSAADGEDLEGTALYTPQQRAELEQRFARIQELVRKKGVLAGTGHQRLTIPKRVLTEQDLTHGLGFTPVTVAIPEAGQDRFRSWRHPEHNFHIHSHGDRWTIHEDAHAAATMLARKAKGVKAKSHAMLQGMPHVSEEGLPGLYYYAKGLVTGQKSTADRVQSEMDPDTLNLLNQMPASSTYKQAMLATLEHYGISEKWAEKIRVPSQSDGRKRYTIDPMADGTYRCSCPDFQYRHQGKGTHCKHITAYLEAQKAAKKKYAPERKKAAADKSDKKKDKKDEAGSHAKEKKLKSKAGEREGTLDKRHFDQETQDKGPTEKHEEHPEAPKPKAPPELLHPDQSGPAQSLPQLSAELDALQKRLKRHTLNLEHAPQDFRFSPTFIKLLEKSPVPVTLDKGAYGKNPDWNGWYDLQKKNITLLQADPNILAHEMGHAKFDQSRWGKVLQSDKLYPLFDMAPVLGTIGGAISGAMSGAGAANPWITAGTAGLPLLLNAPMMASEAMASINGNKFMRQSGASAPERKDYKSQMWNAYGSYAAFPAATVGGHLMGHLGADYLSRQMAEQKARELAVDTAVEQVIKSVKPPPPPLSLPRISGRPGFDTIFH